MPDQHPEEPDDIKEAVHLARLPFAAFTHTTPANWLQHCIIDAVNR
ncbi:MAG: hypothetical protein AAGE89_04620 [Pseudomonadota bacterium]